MGKSFIKDFSWYFIGSVIPILIGIIKTPIFTRHFNEADYGYLGIVIISFSFLSMILFSWMNSCLWRFYPKYQYNKERIKLFSNLFLLFLIAFSVLFVISAFWYFSENSILIKNLIFYSFLHLFFNQLYQFYIIIIRLDRKSVFYTIFQSIRAIIILFVALVQVFIFGTDITALISSLLIVDFFAVLFLIFVNPSNISVNLGLSNRNILNEILIYGSAGLFINFCFLSITYSDRYIISWLGDISDVGIYDQVYKISQLFVAALVSVFFNTINPTLLNELERKFENSEKLIQQIIKVYVVYGLPFIFYLSFFSKEIATILLGENFRTGYTIMPFIFMSAYLHGISNFYELRLKFADKLKKISFIVGGAALLNIVLTIMFVLMYGYKWAAITTFITYCFLLFVFHNLDKKLILIKKNTIRFVFKMLFLFTTQIVVFLLLINLYETTLILKILVCLPFLILYYVFFQSQFRNIELPKIN